jgi:hypothetical protein
MRGPITSADIIAHLPFLPPQELRVIIDVAMMYHQRYVLVPTAALAPPPPPVKIQEAQAVQPKQQVKPDNTIVQATVVVPEITQTYVRRFCGDAKCRGCIYNFSLKKDSASS